MGVYHFSGLPTDEYTLKLFSPGFKSLTVKSIHILESEQKSIPTLQLEVGSMADCGGHACLTIFGSCRREIILVISAEKHQDRPRADGGKESTDSWR